MPFVIAAIAVSTVVPVQSRLTGELSRRLGDPTAAGALSLGVALALVILPAFLSPRVRGGLRAVVGATRDGRLPRRYLAAGVVGGVLALAQSVAALVTGIALFTVALIAGQTLGGLVVDWRGIGGGGVQPPRGLRLVGALVVVVAAAISASPSLTGAPEPVVVASSALGALVTGALLGLQQAANGAVAAVGSPIATTWLNFVVATAFLVVVWGTRRLTGSASTVPLPGDWWLYLGGVCGVVFIGGAAFLVRKIGVLLLGLASVAGQLVSSIAVDLVVPSGGPSSLLVTTLGASLAIVGIGIASRSRR